MMAAAAAARISSVPATIQAGQSTTSWTKLVEVDVPADLRGSGSNDNKKNHNNHNHNGNALHSGRKRGLEAGTGDKTKQPPTGRRRRNRRGSDDIKRDEMVEAFLHENRRMYPLPPNPKTEPLPLTLPSRRLRPPLTLQQHLNRSRCRHNHPLRDSTRPLRRRRPRRVLSAAVLRRGGRAAAAPPPSHQPAARVAEAAAAPAGRGRGRGAPRSQAGREQERARRGAGCATAAAGAGQEEIIKVGGWMDATNVRGRNAWPAPRNCHVCVYYIILGVGKHGK